VDHGRGDSGDGRGIDQSPFEVLTEAVKGLGARLDRADEQLRSLSVDEIREFREFKILLPRLQAILPQIEDMIEARRFRIKVLKAIGATTLGFPAAWTIWQAILKGIDWIKHQ
jgi:hypothetical protein